MRTRDLSGPWGEALAAEYLRKKGWRIEAMNYRTRLGEIDIIASNRQYLVFCEVKLRKSANFAAAREFVDARKQQRLILQPEFDGRVAVAVKNAVICQNASSIWVICGRRVCVPSGA